MSCIPHSESAIAVAERIFSRPELLARAMRAVSLVRTWSNRRRQRRELLDYIASDHRVAADIGITGCEARNWSQRPFWRNRA